MRGRHGYAGISFEIRSRRAGCRRGDEVSGELRARLPSESGLPEARDGLRPAEDLLDAFPDPLADLVAGVANRAAVHCGAPALVPGLRDVRHDSPLAASSDEVDQEALAATESVAIAILDEVERLTAIRPKPTIGNSRRRDRLAPSP